MLLSFGAMTAAACGSSSEHPSGGAGGTTTQTAPDDASTGCGLDLGPAPSACDLCKAQKCCHTFSAQKEKPGTWTNSAVNVCASNECATACGLEVPECGGITPDPASCAPALYAACCDEVTACGQSDECVAVIYLCIDDQKAFPGSQAFSSCAAQYPQGLELFDALNACSSQVTCN